MQKELEDLTPETSNRLLKSRVESLLKQLQQSNQKALEQGADLKRCQEKLKDISKERDRFFNQLRAKEETIKKLDSSLKSAQTRLQSIEIQNANLRKELAVSKVDQHQLNETKKAVEKLAIVQNELKNCKDEIKVLKQTHKETMEIEKKKFNQLHNDKKDLEKQKMELLTFAKKQMKLIDILKKQKMHLEVVQALEFAEDQFVHVVEKVNHKI